MRNVIFVFLLAVTVVTVYVFWFPAAKETMLMEQKAVVEKPLPKLEERGDIAREKDTAHPWRVPERRLPHPPPAPAPADGELKSAPGGVVEPAPPKETSYAKFKREMKEWLEIGSKAVPVVSFLGAVWVKRKKKK